MEMVDVVGVVATVVDLTGGKVEAVVVFVGIFTAGSFTFCLKAGLFGEKCPGGGGGLLDLISFLIFCCLSGTGAVRESSSS